MRCFLGLLGLNGAGKSALIKALAGFLRNDSGSILVLCHYIQKDFSLASESLGVDPQEIVMEPSFSVREPLPFKSGYIRFRDNEVWIVELLDKLDLTDMQHTNYAQTVGGGG